MILTDDDLTNMFDVQFKMTEVEMFELTKRQMFMTFRVMLCRRNNIKSEK